MLNIDDRLIREISPIIKPNALAVLLAIAIHLSEKRGRCFPKHETLMELTGLGRDAVYAALNTLKDAGLLKVYQQINKAKKTFGRRSFQVSTRFIGVFFAASDIEPLPENPDTDEPDTAHPETEYINKLLSVANATERAIPQDANVPKGVEVTRDPGTPIDYDFEKFWNDYGFKHGSKKNAKAKWSRLKTDEVQQIKNTLEIYKRETTTSDAGRDRSNFKPMRKHPEFYISGKIWETYSDVAAESSGPTKYDELYNQYLQWVNSKHPHTVPAVQYLSKSQYIAVKEHAYKPGSRAIGDDSLKFLLNFAHEKTPQGSGRDVYGYFCQLIDERLKAHNV